MTLSAGTRLGTYEVVAAIGAGGMGEVFRARDTTLNRDIAIKVLPAALAADPERLARFKREAQLLASLSHSNIAHVYGFEAATLSDGTTAHFLAMELVEGEDLAERLKRGAIPVDEAIAIARQMAEGLEEAHEHGIIHRDLKPANIKVTPDGKVKILDFGLAKALEEDPSKSGANSQLSHSPTMSRHLTEAGMIMGTAAYMSPEQARGKAVDKRADIWSFGVVLFEMLAGTRLFAGETVSDTLAAVLKTDPDWSLLPAATPIPVSVLLRRCLERDPRQRLRDIGDARVHLAPTPAGEGASVPTLAATRAQRTKALAPWLLSALLALVLILPGLRAGGPNGAASGSQALRLQFSPPGGERLALTNDLPAFALSPDGTKIVYAVEAGASSELRLQSLDSEVFTAIPGSEQGMAPFFSPDGKWIAFSAGPVLKKVALAGGAPVTIAEAPLFRGGAWGEDGSIYFVPRLYVPVSRIPPGGGPAEPVTTIRTAEGELQHRWPVLLPGEKVLIYTVHSGGSWDDATIVAQQLDSGQRKVLVRGGTAPCYLPTGQLIYARAGGLYAVTLDPGSLEVKGPAVEVVSDVFVSGPGWAGMSVSRSGLLATVPQDRVGSASVLSWVDREGRGSPLKFPAAAYYRVSLAPGGDRAAVGDGNQISVLDLNRLSVTRLTVAGRVEYPIFGPDGRRVFFGLELGQKYQVHSNAADDSGASTLTVSSDGSLDPVAISTDGTRMLALRVGKGPNALVLHDLSRPQSDPLTLFQSPHIYFGYASFSPDGRFVAYQTEESGRPEIYVRPTSGDGRKWQISTEGGTAPVWSGTGGEIFFLSGPKIVATSVLVNGNELVAGQPKVLFENRRVRAFDAARDGRRFLIAEDPNPGSRPGINITVNWFAEVKRKLQAARTP